MMLFATLMLLQRQNIATSHDFTPLIRYVMLDGYRAAVAADAAIMLLRHAMRALTLLPAC